MPRKKKEEVEAAVELPVGKLVSGRFRIEQKLGEGGCGAVYEVLDMKTKTRAALKVEANNVAGGSVLKMEVDILQRLHKRQFVARVLHSGKRAIYSYVVMTLLGPSLQHLWKSRCAGRPLTESTTVRIGLQTLYGIKQLHDIGFIHRDIKPANLALGHGSGIEGRFIHLLDFGLARAYVKNVDDKDNPTLRPSRPDGQVLFRGTIRYCSFNVQQRKEQGRHDDLWSLMYMLIEISGGLPWSKETDRDKLMKAKLGTSDLQLLGNRAGEMHQILIHLRTLTYSIRPNYALIANQLAAIMRRKSYNLDDRYDWEPPTPARGLPYANIRNDEWTTHPLGRL